jgi:hypothetical protein
MIASSRDPAGPEIVTQENVLLDAAERIGRIRDGRVAVHLHLSRLKMQNRQEGYLRVAGRMLEPMVSAFRGQIFLLANADIVFLVNQPNPLDLRNHLHKLRGLFAKDPLTREDGGDGADLFCTVYDLSFDYDAFLAMVRQALADARERVRHPQPSTELRLLDLDSLSDLLDRLTLLDAAPFVRRQSAISLDGHGVAEVMFQEFFIGLSDLQRAVAPDLQLHSNRWMFQHLAATLDQRLLAALQRLRLARRPPMIHLNLTLPSLKDPAFLAFEAALPAGLGLGIELQCLDLLADSRAFYAARAALREKGHRLAIDGLDEATLRFLDIGRADADLYKIEWSPELRQADRSDAVLSAVRALDPAKLLLARCDSEAAITWGLDHGLMKFQGRYVEAMLAATTMGLCDQAAACSLAQCTQRHGVIGGPLRAECGNHQRLDTPPPMRAPQRKARPA